MRLKDILTRQEDDKVQALKLELLDAPDDITRRKILEEINGIFEQAKIRYYTEEI